MAGEHDLIFSSCVFSKVISGSTPSPESSMCACALVDSDDANDVSKEGVRIHSAKVGGGELMFFKVIFYL